MVRSSQFCLIVSVFTEIRCGSLIGIIALQILKDFLQNLNLKQTLTIFEAEVGYEVIQLHLPFNCRSLM